MKGVKFVIDEDGERSAVLIDLKENPELWEDFYDAFVAREREGEPRESLEEVRQKLKAQGKLAGVASTLLHTSATARRI
jgi:hypothetical protein